MNMSKSFQLVGLEGPVPSTSTHTTQTNWKLCVICQEDKSESLTSPSKFKRKYSGGGYSSFAANLIRFSELGQLPGTLQLERLNEGCGIEAAMVANNALYHHACKLKYSIIIIKFMCSRCRRDDIHVCFAYASPQRMPHMYDHKIVSLKYII